MSAALADIVDCEDYHVLEMRAICEEVGGYVNAYDKVTPGGLNDLVESWGYETGVFLIPPGEYTITRKVHLRGQKLLPHPTQKLPDGLEDRVIKLVVSDSFKYNDDLRLLEMDDSSSAGGIEFPALSDVIGNQLLSGGLDNPKSTLIYLATGMDVTIAGCVMTGHQKLDSMVYIPADYGPSGRSTPQDFKFLRNHVRLNGALTGLHLATGASSSRLIKNNALFIQSPVSGSRMSGLYLVSSSDNPGSLDMTNNDVIYPSQQAGESRQQRHGVEVATATRLSVRQNAAYTPGATAKNNHDIFIYDNRSVSTENKNLISIMNSISANIRFGASNPQGEATALGVKNEGLRILPDADAYLYSDPRDFRRNTADLGVVPTPVSWMLNPDNATCGADYYPTDSTASYLSDRSGSNQEALISLDSVETSGKVLLKRLLIKTASGHSGIKGSLAVGQQLTVKDSLIEIDGAGSSGITLTEGKVSIVSTDLSFTKQCSSGCEGVVVDRPGQVNVEDSVSWSTGNGNTLLDLRYNSSVINWFTGNVVSPRIDLMVVGEDEGFVKAGIQQVSASGIHPLSIPKKFFRYTGHLGASAIPKTTVVAACEAGNGTKNTIDPLRHQSLASLNDSGFNVSSLQAVSEVQCPSCPDRINVGQDVLITELVFWPVATLTTFLVSCAIGRRYYSPTSYNLMDTAGSIQ